MSFSTINEVYDLINGSAYEPYAVMLKNEFENADIEVREVLDLGCGTGGISALLADDGFDMIALDVSPEMLNVARERNFGKNTLLLCQDMREFELYGTVQAVFSSFDCLNYITNPDDLKQVFSLVHNYLEPGGIFIFDVNTEYRYREILDGKNFVFEFEDSMTVWRSFFSEEEKTCEFVLDTFAENEDGTYDRACEDQLQKLHTREEILEAAKGFSLVSVSGGKGFDGCTEREKEYYVFKRD
jgi:SAM-dependent methyltransferase